MVCEGGAYVDETPVDGKISTENNAARETGRSASEARLQHGPLMQQQQGALADEASHLYNAAVQHFSLSTTRSLYLVLQHLFYSFTACRATLHGPLQLYLSLALYLTRCDLRCKIFQFTVKPGPRTLQQVVPETSGGYAPLHRC